jgi:hypothetical protein
MNGYCPKCGQTVNDLLCETCGWFGDDVLNEAPVGADIVASIVVILNSYRDICRDEILLEQVGPDSKELIRARQLVGYCKQEILGMFIGTVKPIKQTLQRGSGIVPWPTNWLDYHYNSKDPCDTLIGPCACGAWHQESEDWVQEKLTIHNAVIQ